jgi:hypothetical protein
MHLVFYGCDCVGKKMLHASEPDNPRMYLTNGKQLFVQEDTSCCVLRQVNLENTHLLEHCQSLQYNPKMSNCTFPGDKGL